MIGKDSRPEAYKNLKNSIALISGNIQGLEEDMQNGAGEHHNPQELLAMLVAIKRLCEFVLEQRMEYVEIEEGQKCIQAAMTACRRYALVATEADQKMHDFEDTIFFLQWLLNPPSSYAGV